MSQWQPIKTAPKDGSFVLLCGGTTNEYFSSEEEDPLAQRPVVGMWDAAYEEWSVAYWDGGWRTAYETPTHWMPLPPPPSKEQG